ncbi:MAG: hypothetical protein ICV71_00945 [Thermoleophilia bacterium]|nr:hypothetical protein [Thermoleophilia bacterium]MDQ3858515.1 hypothetical protein [Actinomycetota bacterium]
MSAREPRKVGPTPPATFWTPGEGLAWVASIIFTLSSFMGWYSGLVDGLELSALGWHTGILGKLVLVIGLAVLGLLVLRAAGVELPPAIPIGLVIAGLGAIGTIFVLIRLLEVPEDYAGLGRSIGIWISLMAAVLLIVAGLLKATEEA